LAGAVRHGHLPADHHVLLREGRGAPRLLRSDRLRLRARPVRERDGRPDPERPRLMPACSNKTGEALRNSPLLRRIAAHALHAWRDLVVLDREYPGLLAAMDRHGDFRWPVSGHYDPAAVEAFLAGEPAPEAGAQPAPSAIDWPAVLAAAPTEGINAWLAERGIPRVEFFRRRKALAEAA